MQNSIKFSVEYTDTFAGEANYCWVKRGTVTAPQLTHYGYDGTHGYSRASKAQQREVMRRAKAMVGLTGVPGVTHAQGDMFEFRPRGMATVLFVTCEG